MLNFLHSERVFYDLFEQLAARTVSSAAHLVTLATTYPASEHPIQLIRNEEHRADDITHEILAKLDGSFQTPIDREDIHSLAGVLDNIVDSVDALAKRFPLFHVATMEANFVEQASVLLEAVRQVEAAVKRLRDRRSMRDMLPHLIEIHRLENVADDFHYAAVSSLFDGTHELLFVLKWKELYTRLEDAIDGCEKAAQCLRHIVIRNA